jgi:hypothetical protein
VKLQSISATSHIFERITEKIQNIIAKSKNLKIFTQEVILKDSFT